MSTIAFDFDLNYHKIATLFSEAAIDIDNAINNRSKNLAAMKKSADLLQKFVEQCLDHGMVSAELMARHLFIDVMLESIFKDSVTIKKEAPNLAEQLLLATALVVANRLQRGKPTEEDGKFCLVFSKKALSLAAEKRR